MFSSNLSARDGLRKDWSLIYYSWITILVIGMMMEPSKNSCTGLPVALDQESPWPGSLVRDFKIYPSLEASPVRSKRAISDFFRDLIAETFGEDTTPQPNMSPSIPAGAADHGTNSNPEPMPSVVNKRGESTGTQNGVSNAGSGSPKTSNNAPPPVRDATPAPAEDTSGATGNKWIDLILGAIVGGGTTNTNTGTASDSTGNTIVNAIASAAVQHILAGVLAG